MADYSYTIDKVTTLPFFGGQYDVVSQIEWHMTAKAGAISTDYYAVTPIPTDDLTNFTPYSQLTNDDMVAWLQRLVDIDWVKSCIDFQLQQLQVQKTNTQSR